ncbi:hypothetical protein PAPHI01_1631 [Pancytospora philotis]|nr:hypothetical protein PAPHI01_1631 [Pancytospora philotis]
MFEISFAEHSIPSVALAAIVGTSIFYVHDGALCVYHVDSRESKAIAPAPGAQQIFAVGRVVCVVAGSTMRRFRSTLQGAMQLEDAILSGTPTAARAFADGAVLLYDGYLELCRGEGACKKLDYSAALGRGTVVDVQIAGEYSYLLSSSGKLYRCKNIFSTEAISVLREMTVMPAGSSSVFKSFTIVDSSLFACSDDTVHCFRIHALSLVLSYTLKGSGRLFGNLLCGEEVVELGNAPYKCLPDRLYGYSDGVGLAAGRVYFFSKPSAIPPSTPSNDAFTPLPVTEVTVNPNDIPAPSYITDAAVLASYKELLARIKQHSVVAANVSRLSDSFAPRVSEVLEHKSRIDAEVRGMTERIEGFRARMASILDRARRAMPREDVLAFDRNLGTLREMLDAFELGDIKEAKRRLQAQNTVLKSKIIK